jgi:bis(5'-nucleosyl)-tetraphosphatase (symmetrical)
MDQWPKQMGVPAIDTGCLWGGKITAVRFPDRRIYQEDCPCWADPFKYK